MAGPSKDQPSASKPDKAAPTRKTTATALNLLGNMQRTVIEGLVKATSATSASRKPGPSKQPTMKGESRHVAPSMNPLPSASRHVSPSMNSPPSASRHVSPSMNPPPFASKHGSQSINSPPPSKHSSSIPPPPSAKPTTQASKSAPSTKPSTKISKPALPLLIPSPSAAGSPSHHPSVLKTQHDIHMASRQPTIDHLPPAEKHLQEKWAQNQLKMHSKTCPAKLNWKRTKDGYKCEGGFHKVTHELLAEGKGGLWFDWSLHDGAWRDKWIGPLYGGDVEDAYFREGRFAVGKFRGGEFRRKVG